MAKAKETKKTKEKVKKTPKAAKEEYPTIKGALGRLGMYQRTSATLILAASAETKASPEEVWNVWVELEKWPAWQKPLVSNAKWVEKREWEPGAKFEQTLNWGGSLGKAVSVESVREVNKHLNVTWTQIHKGPSIFGGHPMGSKSCGIWYFEPLQDGGTRIIYTLVMVSMRCYFARLTGARKKWNAGFKVIVDNLVKAVDRAQQNKTAAAPSDPAKT